LEADEEAAQEIRVAGYGLRERAGMQIVSDAGGAMKSGLSLAALLAFVAASLPAAGLPSFSDPAPSPDDKKLAFVSGGDIWIAPAAGGEAHLLVSNPATESRPLFSPDGKELAFVSDRTGNGDIYVLGLATGELRRLTFSDAPEHLDAWSADGKWIYFTSPVNDVQGNNDIFRVSAEGGTPLEVSGEIFVNEYYGAPSPDGSKIALCARGFSMAQWWRLGHSHLDESEIWVKKTREDGGYRRLIGGGAKQDWPMWRPDGHALFFVSDCNGAQNLWVLSLEGNSPARPVTKFTSGRFLFPTLSANGKSVYFERDFAIWKADTRTGAAVKLALTLDGVPDGPAVHLEHVTTFDSLALSPDGKKIALTAHGEVFAASAKDGGDALRLTHTAAPEEDLHWTPDSNRLIYVSERNGNGQIFSYDFRTAKETQLTRSAGNDELPLAAPDGKSLAYVRDGRELRIVSLDDAGDHVLATGQLREPALCWSPDSKWIAFAETGAKSFRTVMLVPASGGTPREADFLANGETAGVIAWSPDGSFLLFDTAQRSEPSYIARVDLAPHAPKFQEDQFQELFETKPVGNDSSGKHDNGAKAPAAAPHVWVSFDGIRDRLTLLPLGLNADGPVISPDGKTLLFSARAAGQVNLFTYSLDELAREKPVAGQLTATAGAKRDYAFTPDSKEAVYLDAGKVERIPLDGHPSKPIAVAADLPIDFDSEKVAAFRQGWSLLNRYFVNADFNGVDWNKECERYTPYIEGSRTGAEMRRVMSLMIGDLNSSHSGIAGPPVDKPVPVGRLGLRFDRLRYERGEGLIVGDIVPMGPAAVEGTIHTGDRLLAVNGAAIGPHTNLDSLLEDETGKKVTLEIAPLGDESKKRSVTVQPISSASEMELRYRQWVNANRAYVERISHGRLGYIHMKDMSEASLDQLYIDLDIANETKDGVVIDIRDNDGGFVNGYALDVFARRNYLTMTPRGMPPVPARAWLGQRALGAPTVLVTNEGSLSDAEDFTEGYRALKLGKVVGEPTAGWIIYTWGARLIDGSLLRLPEARVQDAHGETMEMHPRPVDIEVARPLGESFEGKDSQLDRAVAVLLGQIGK
jgi:tricorn protease